MKKWLDQLHADAVPQDGLPISDLTTELLMWPAACDPDDILAEIVKLDGLINDEADGPRRDWLCASFQALMWARAGGVAFAAPSDSIPKDLGVAVAGIEAAFAEIARLKKMIDDIGMTVSQAWKRADTRCIEAIDIIEHGAGVPDPRAG